MANFNLRSLQASVASAGTAVQLTATKTLARFVIVKADPDNTVAVFLGNDAAGDVTTSNGFQLDPGDVVELDPGRLDMLGDERIDLSSFWIDSASGTPAIHVLYLA